MSSESGLSETAHPSDAILEKTLRDIVRKAEVDPITVKRVRTAAEERLGLDAGFFKSHDEWNEKSKEIIEDAFNQPSQKSPSPEPTPPKKTPSQAKTPKRTSTSKTQPASKRQKRSVSESEEQSDFESEEEPKPKTKPAQRQSQTVDSDKEEEQEDDQDGENAADHDSESEMSVVLDEVPPKKQRKKSTSAGPKTKAQPKSKATKAAAKTSELSEEEQTIKRLQGELLKCGVRKLWHRELASYDTPRAKIGHLKQMLKDVGIVGRFSEQKAKAIKERRELEEDLAAVQEGAKQWGDDGEKESEAEDAPRPQRRAAAATRFVDFGEDDDDDDDE
ncbi:hypothetical protein QM012_005641 [Aureobasidium pullulans]|uniref:DEK-C domain-containing protein n=1 Tax=Aureobasidium pullulans TaxID=5580 RepID=A0ABR0TQA9_AURPU